MFKNISSKTLLIIFTTFLIIAVFFIYYDSSHEERTFKKDIVYIDTSKVTAISIYPNVTNHKEVKLFKEGNYWRVQFDNSKSFPAQNSKVKNLLDQLIQIKVNSVAAQEESKWNEFKVDSSGTRVKIFEGSENTLDVIIGKFTFQQPRTMASYVRLKGEKNVYEVPGVLEFSFNQKPNDFRNNHLINDDVNNWKRLTFDYPADSSFQLLKDSSGYWCINNLRADSAKTTSFLRTLSLISSTDFVDNIDQSLLGKSRYKLTIESSAFSVVTIYAYENIGNILIHSSQNPDAYFDGKANFLLQKIFVGKNTLLKEKK